MNAQTQMIEIQELPTFCDGLPAPIIGKPVLTANRSRGLMLEIDCAGQRVTVAHDGAPIWFPSLDAVMYELDGIANLERGMIAVQTEKFFSELPRK